MELLYYRLFAIDEFITAHVRTMSLESKANEEIHKLDDYLCINSDNDDIFQA